MAGDLCHRYNEEMTDHRWIFFFHHDDGEMTDHGWRSLLVQRQESDGGLWLTISLSPLQGGDTTDHGRHGWRSLFHQKSEEMTDQ